MTPRSPTLSPAAAPALAHTPEKAGGGIMGGIAMIWAEFKTDTVATILFALALVVGFIHGWLKLKYAATWITFAFDIPIIGSLVMILATLPPGTRWFPKCGVSTAVQLLVAVCALWAILPFPVPWLASLASFRAWCFSPFLFLLGYHLMKTVRKIELVVWGVMLLGAGTAVYGVFFQTEAEIREMMKASAEMQLRLVGNFYATSTGAEFRRFSTFVSAAVFGVTMAACTQFAAARLMLPGCGWIQRLVLTGIAGICAYAVVLSGSRTSLILLVASLFLTGIVRRGKLQWVVLPVLAGGAIYMGFSATHGGASERFGSILDLDTLSGRVYIVLSPAIDSIVKAPLGNGVGASGYGVPGVLSGMLQQIMNERGSTGVLESADGDLGRLIVDLGIVGIIVYAFLVFHGVRDSIRWMWTLRDSRLGVVGVPAGAWFFMSLVQIPTGSPYLGIPFGPLTWVLFGALRRMMDEYQRLEKIYGEDVDSLPQFASFVTSPRIASLYGRKPLDSAAPRPAAMTADRDRPARRLPGTMPNRVRGMMAKRDAGRPAEPERKKKRFLFPDNNK